MLREISPEKFYEWMAFAALEPFDETRQDIRTARLMAVLATLRTGKSFSHKDFAFTFGDTPSEAAVRAEVTPTNSWQYLKFVAQMHVAVANAEEERIKRG